MDATFKNAQALAKQVVAEDWPALGIGTLWVDPNGYEDATTWAVLFDTREHAVDGDVMFLLLDPPLAMVDKRTGFVTVTSYLVVADQIDEMTPVTVG